MDKTQQTHIDTVLDGALLQSSVVRAGDLAEEGAAPGAKAKVHYNGPTSELATLASGLCVLEPGASPHPPHRHAEEEIMIVASGTGEIVVDGVTTLVGPGDEMYTAADAEHGIVNTGDTAMTFYFLKWLGRGRSGSTS